MMAAIECEGCDFALRTETDTPNDAELSALMDAHGDHKSGSILNTMNNISHPTQEGKRVCKLDAMRAYVQIPEHLQNAEVVTVFPVENPDQTQESE